MNPIRFLCFLAFLFACTLALAACMAGDPTAPTAPEIAQYLATALEDNVLTQAELEGLSSLMQQAIDGSQRTDWTTLIATAIGSVGASLLGVRYLPSGAFQGPFDKKVPA
jgi:Na+-driven multidrug efflux pump